MMVCHPPETRPLSDWNPISWRTGKEKGPARGPTRKQRSFDGQSLPVGPALTAHSGGWGAESSRAFRKDRTRRQREGLSTRFEARPGPHYDESMVNRVAFRDSGTARARISATSASGATKLSTMLKKKKARSRERASDGGLGARYPRRGGIEPFDEAEYSQD